MKISLKRQQTALRDSNKVQIVFNRITWDVFNEYEANYV